MRGLCHSQGAEKMKAAQQEGEALRRETALAAAALEGRTQALARQEAAAAEIKALLAVRTKELDKREASLTDITQNDTLPSLASVQGRILSLPPFSKTQHALMQAQCALVVTPSRQSVRHHRAW